MVTYPDGRCCEGTQTHARTYNVHADTPIGVGAGVHTQRLACESVTCTIMLAISDTPLIHSLTDTHKDKHTHTHTHRV